MARLPPPAWTLLMLQWMLNGIAESRVRLVTPGIVTLEQNSTADVTITSSSLLNQSAVIQLNVTYSSKPNISSIIALPEQLLLPVEKTSVTFSVKGVGVGQVTAYLISNHTEISSFQTRIRFLVVRSNILSVVSAVVGWMYFVAWSVSFYPQGWENWRRQSVVGLNFDFLALNTMGFFVYSVFNIGLFFITDIKEEFLRSNPNGINPVQANDVFFSVHALALCLVYALQATMYERGGQKVSRTALILLLIGLLFALVSLFVAVAKVITWLEYLYYFSYIKLGVTLVKYVPQAYMNYKRQSTEGWSIGNVLLDFTGGVLSILQMILQSYNNDEWMLIFGDPTKFGLGLFSVFLDILFMVQHYCLYAQRSSYQPLPQEQN